MRPSGLQQLFHFTPGARKPMKDRFLLEIEDARALIAQMCGDPNAFDFEMQRTPAVHDEHAAPSYTVTVGLRGQRVQYLSGYGLDWVGQFELDLWRGVFGRPLKKWD